LFSSPFFADDFRQIDAFRFFSILISPLAHFRYAIAAIISFFAAAYATLLRAAEIFAAIISLTAFRC
jgi:hypothetical protein